MNAINWIDIAIILCLGLFGLMGFIKGFTQRILSLISWAGSILLSFRLFPYLRPFINQYVSGTTATVLTSAVLFITLLILFKLTTNAITSLIHKSPLSGLDRMLGVIFGLLMGGLILSLVAIIVSVFVPRSHYPNAIRTSKLWPYVVRGQDYIEGMSPLKKNSLTRTPLLKNVGKVKQVKESKAEESSGYSAKERSQLDQLIGQIADDKKGST